MNSCQADLAGRLSGRRAQLVERIQSQTGREVSPDVYEWRPEVPASLLQNVLHVTLLAFLEAFDRLVFLYGWDDGPWSSWRTHVKKKIVTGPRVQVQ